LSLTFESVLPSWLSIVRLERDGDVVARLVERLERGLAGEVGDG
jgi:hypothetical protein